MAADLNTVLKKITSVLNSSSPGTFSSTIGTGYLDRTADEISEAAREAALMIARAIVSNPQHAHRGVFVSGTPTSLTHQAELPDMAGEPVVEIQPYSGADWKLGVLRDAQMVESFRLNPGNVYNSKSHTTQGSPLSGYYAVKDGRIYFTGYAARAYFPVIDRTTVTGLIPDEAEGAWVSIGVGLCLKEGDNLLPIGNHYLQNGLNELNAIANQTAIQPLPQSAQGQKNRGNV